MNFIKLSLWGKNEAFFLSVAAIASITEGDSKGACLIRTVDTITYEVTGTPNSVMEKILQAQAEAAVGVAHPGVTTREAQTFAGERRV